VWTGIGIAGIHILGESWGSSGLKIEKANNSKNRGGALRRYWRSTFFCEIWKHYVLVSVLFRLGRLGPHCMIGKAAGNP
jgi:hypothetical protein